MKDILKKLSLVESKQQNNDRPRPVKTSLLKELSDPLLKTQVKLLQNYNTFIKEAQQIWDGKAVVISDKQGNILDTLSIEDAADKYGINAQDIKNQLKIQDYTTLTGSKGPLTVSRPMVPTPLDTAKGFTE